jgi:hypothetical protein
MPFRVPEGYFDSFKREVRKQQASSLWKIFAPYATVAASFLLIVSAGTFILEKTVSKELMSQEDYIIFSDNMMNTINYEMDTEYKLAEAEINEEDIINYLIYSGISAEEIELSK